MSIATLFRWWFMALFMSGFLAVLIMIARLIRRRHRVEARQGPLPSPGILVQLGIPTLFLITRWGEVDAGLWALRGFGVILSVYFLVMMPWVMRTLKRFALPGAGLYRDHQLITYGPYRYMRHPLYSAAIILWLSTAIGTLNWILLVLWPLLIAVMINIPVRHEDRLLEAKFGDEFTHYALQTPRLIPRLNRQAGE